MKLEEATKEELVWWIKEHSFELRKAMGSFSADSVNDICALEDLPDVPGGDGRYASWNYGPLARWDELSIIRALGGKAPEGE